jgi:hypothetical protein
MTEHLHELMRDELKQTARTDTVFASVSLILNLLTLAVNSAVAVGISSGADAAAVAVMLAFIVLMGVTAFIAYQALRHGQRIRLKLLKGLMKMYEEHGVSSYYDSSIMEDLGARYRLYTLLLLSSSSIAVLVPLLIVVLG